MASLDIAALIRLLENPRTDVAVVTLRLEPAPEVAAGQVAEGRYLNLDETLRTRFRTGLRRSLVAVRNRAVEEYEAGWINIDDKLADADASELSGPVLPAVRAALRGEVAHDFDAAGERADAERADAEREAQAAESEAAGGEAPAQDAEAVVGGYAVVARRGSDEPAIFFRRRDPVERLTRNQFTARLLGTRLTTIEDVFIFEAGFDLVAWGDRALIKNAAAFEALFLNDTVRREGARKAAGELKRRVAVANPTALDDAIRDDIRFAGRLRAIERRGVLERLDLAAVERATKRFNIENRMLRNGQLVFVPRLRFVWLSAIEDSLVESSGTGALSVARIRSEWRRREVSCIERDGDGNVTALVGDWGRTEASDAFRRLRAGSETYYKDLPDGRAEIDLDEEQKPARLVAQVGEDPRDRLSDIPACPPR